MNPLILAIETATDACSVAISSRTDTYAKLVVAPQAHAQLILGMVNEICQQAGLALHDLQAFAFGRGPGSFTGVRIAASVIQGLALGMQKPVIAVSSLQALAQQAANVHKGVDVLALIDARMHEVYWSTYAIDAAGLVASKSADALLKPEALVLDPNTPYVAVGTGLTYTNLLLPQNPGLQIDSTIIYPRAAEVLQLAIAKFQRGETAPAHAAIPTYVRNDVAIKKDQRKETTGKKNPDLGSRD